MQIFLSIVHIIVGIFLVIVVLLQVGKAGGLSGLLGGGGGDQLFSTPSGTAFLRKLTVTLAILFFITSLGLTFLSYKNKTKSVTSRFQQIPVQQPQSPPEQ